MNKQNINKTQRVNFVFIFPRLRVVGKIGKQPINHVLFIYQKRVSCSHYCFFFPHNFTPYFIYRRSEAHSWKSFFILLF